MSLVCLWPDTAYAELVLGPRGILKYKMLLEAAYACQLRTGLLCIRLLVVTSTMSFETWEWKDRCF